MTRLLKLIYFAGLISLLSACETNTSKQGVTFTVDSFRRYAVSLDRSKKFGNDTLLLTHPRLVRIHPQGFLLLKESTPEGQLAIVDLMTGTKSVKIKRGRGPKEVFNVRDIVAQDSCIWVSDIQQSKVIHLALSRDTRTFQIDSVYRFADVQFLRISPFVDNGFLALNMTLPGERMLVFDGKGNVSKTAGSYPPLDKTPDIVPNNSILQSDISVAPDLEHTAVVCRSIDYIDIYDSDLTLKKRLRGPMGAEIGVETVTKNGNTRFLQKPMYFMYNNITSNKDRFMVGYVGVKPEPDSADDTGIRSIFVFDWNGTPLKSYDFDRRIAAFDMDWERNEIYCLVETPEPKIFVVDLASIERDAE